MVCRAFSRVVVDTCWECCPAERTPVGVEEAEMVDKRLVRSIMAYSRRMWLKISLLTIRPLAPELAIV